MNVTLGLITSLASWSLYVVVVLTVGTTLCQLLFRVDVSTPAVATGSVIGVMLSAFVFALDAVFLTGSWAGIIEHDMLALLWQSQNGDTLSYRAVGFALVGVGCLTGRVGRAIALLGAALILWSFVLRGHIADRDSLVLAILLLLHLGVACIWFGILLPLRQLTIHDSAMGADLGERFARVAIWAVPVLLIAGLVMSAQLLGSLSDLVGTEYGRMLLLKVLAVGVLLGLAALNKQLLVPKLRNGDTGARDRLVKSITAEAVVGLAILWATALLTTRYALPM